LTRHRRTAAERNKYRAKASEELKKGREIGQAGPLWHSSGIAPALLHPRDISRAKKGRGSRGLLRPLAISILSGRDRSVNGS